MPGYQHLVVIGPVGFFDQNSALVEDKVEAGEVGCGAVGGVGAERAGGVVGLGGDAASA